jgi:hypothetical protein
MSAVTEAPPALATSDDLGPGRIWPVVGSRFAPPLSPGSSAVRGRAPQILRKDFGLLRPKSDPALPAVALAAVQKKAGLLARLF